MKISKLLAAAGLCVLSVSSWAQANDPNINYSVNVYPNARDVALTPVSVTLSARYPTRVSYRVQVNNTSTNALNNSRFTAVTAVLPAGSPAAVFDATAFGFAGGGATCTTGAGGTSINCLVNSTGAPAGTLQPGTSVVFWISVLAPTAGTSMSLTPTFGGAEGGGNGNGCCRETKAAIVTGLTEAPANSNDPNLQFRKQLSSFVPASGGIFFTGTERVVANPRLGGLPTVADPWTTTIVLDSDTPIAATLQAQAVNFTTAKAAESDSIQSCSAVNAPSKTLFNGQPVNRGCNESRLDIPGTFGMTVTLRQHPSIIGKGKEATLANWVILYSKDPDNLALHPYQSVPLCANSGGPFPGQPCIPDNGCRVFSSQSVPAVPRDLWGGFECSIRAIDNGGYKVQ